MKAFILFNDLNVLLCFCTITVYCPCFMVLQLYICINTCIMLFYYPSFDYSHTFSTLSRALLLVSLNFFEKLLYFPEYIDFSFSLNSNFTIMFLSLSLSLYFFYIIKLILSITFSFVHLLFVGYISNITFRYYYSFQGFQILFSLYSSSIDNNTNSDSWYLRHFFGLLLVYLIKTFTKIMLS